MKLIESTRKLDERSVIRQLTAKLTIYATQVEGVLTFPPYKFYATISATQPIGKKQETIDNSV